MYIKGIILFYKGDNVNDYDTVKACGFEFVHFTIDFFVEGFSKTNYIVFDIPKGDFNVGIVTTGLSIHLRLTSTSIYPSYSLTKHMDPLLLPTSKGKYSRMYLFYFPGVMVIFS